MPRIEKGMKVVHRAQSGWPRRRACVPGARRRSRPRSGRPTPPDSHAQVCLTAIERGIDIVCEKPFVSTLAEEFAASRRLRVGICRRSPLGEPNSMPSILLKASSFATSAKSKSSTLSLCTAVWLPLLSNRDSAPKPLWPPFWRTGGNGACRSMPNSITTIASRDRGSTVMR